MSQTKLTPTQEEMIPKMIEGLVRSMITFEFGKSPHPTRKKEVLKLMVKCFEQEIYELEKLRGKL